MARPGGRCGRGARPAGAAQPARNGSAAAPPRDALQPPPRALHPSLRRARSRRPGRAAGFASAHRARLAPRTRAAAVLPRFGEASALPSPGGATGRAGPPEKAGARGHVPARPARRGAGSFPSAPEPGGRSLQPRGRPPPGPQLVPLQPRSELARQVRESARSGLRLGPVFLKVDLKCGQECAGPARLRPEATPPLPQTFAAAAGGRRAPGARGREGLHCPLRGAGEGPARRGLWSWWPRVPGPFTPSYPGAGFPRGRPQGPLPWRGAESGQHGSPGLGQGGDEGGGKASAVGGRRPQYKTR